MFGAEHHVNHVLDVRVGHLSHLRRSASYISRTQPSRAELTSGAPPVLKVKSAVGATNVSPTRKGGAPVNDSNRYLAAAGRRGGRLAAATEPAAASPSSPTPIITTQDSRQIRSSCSANIGTNGRDFVAAASPSRRAPLFFYVVIPTASAHFPDGVKHLLLPLMLSPCRRRLSGPFP
jgi:hypothetical protein